MRWSGQQEGGLLEGVLLEMVKKVKKMVTW